MSVLDPETTGQLLEDLPAGVFAVIVTTFETDSGRLLAALGAAEAANDAEGFARAGHTLAGAAGAVGARDLAATARRAMKAETAEDRATLLPLLRLQARIATSELRGLADAAR